MLLPVTGYVYSSGSSLLSKWAFCLGGFWGFLKLLWYLRISHSPAASVEHKKVLGSVWTVTTMYIKWSWHHHGHIRPPLLVFSLTQTSTSLWGALWEGAYSRACKELSFCEPVGAKPSVVPGLASSGKSAVPQVCVRMVVKLEMVPSKRFHSRASGISVSTSTPFRTPGEAFTGSPVLT